MSSKIFYVAFIKILWPALFPLAAFLFDKWYRMQPVTTITIDEIRTLLKKYLGVATTRATIYNWMGTKKFPKSLGLGKPRRWRKDSVMNWIAKQAESNVEQ